MSEPAFRPPSTPAANAADPGWMPTLGAGALAICGLNHALLGGQYLAFYYLPDGPWYAVVGLLVGGLVALGLAWALLQGHAWAALAGAVVAPVLGVASTSYTLWALWHASFAAFSLFAPPAAALAALLVPFAYGPLQRAAVAQAELRARHGSGPFAVG